MSDDGVSEIVLGLLFTFGGLATLFFPEIPVICWGAIVFGPILLVSGVVKATRTSRPAHPPLHASMSRSWGPPPASRPPAPTQTPPASPRAAPCTKCGNTPPVGARFCN